MSTVLSLAMMTATEVMGGESGAEPGAPRLYLLALEVNGRPAGMAGAARDDKGRIMIRRDDLAAQGIRIPARARSESLNGTVFIPAGDIPGLGARMDEAAASLVLECPARCFGDHRLTAGAALPVAAQPAASGLLLHHDLYAQADNDGSVYASGLFDLTLATPMGRASGSFYARSRGAGRDLVRLDSSWIMEWPGRRTRLQLGDAISRGNDWSLPVRFAGLKFGTDFSLQPGFVSYPTPVFSESAALPSTVEVYVNDVQRFRGDVPAGAFSITDLPVITGDGEARMVITDVLGRQQVITEAFYAAPDLLKPGLTDYAVSLGSLRRFYGRDSANYGAAFAALALRHGLSDAVTLDLAAELHEDFATAGAGGAVRLGRGGVLGGSLALSDGGGALGTVNYDVMAAGWRLSASATRASIGFRQLGYAPGQGVKRQVRARLGLPGGRWGNPSLAYTDDLRHGADGIGPVRTLSAGWALMLGDRLSLLLTATRVIEPQTETAAGLYLTLPLGRGALVGSSANLNRGRDGTRASASLTAQRMPDPERPIGYRADVAAGDLDRYEGRLFARTAKGDFEAAAAHVHGDDSLRLSARGSIAFLGGDVMLARRVYGSYAVVDLPQGPGVGVFLDHRFMGRTDARGRLFLSDLRPYEENRIEIDSRDLPLGLEPGDTERRLTPAAQSGSILRFASGQRWSGVIRLVDRSGRPLPPGTLLRDSHDTAQAREHGETFVVGSNGRTQVGGSDPVVTLMAETAQGRCLARASKTASPDALSPETVSCVPSY